MKKNEKDVNHTKNKIAGSVKETAGKVTDNEQLELKGKVQSMKADHKKNMNDKVDEKKENIAKNMNDKIDKHKRDVKKQK